MPFPTLLLAAVGAYCVFQGQGKQPIPRAIPLHCRPSRSPAFGRGCDFRSVPRPFGHLPLQFMHDGLYGAFWFLLKVSVYIYLFMWLRFTLPAASRFDQLIAPRLAHPDPAGPYQCGGCRRRSGTVFMNLGLNRWLAMVVTTVANASGPRCFRFAGTTGIPPPLPPPLLADSSIVEDSHAGIAANFLFLRRPSR